MAGTRAPGDSTKSGREDMLSTAIWLNLVGNYAYKCLRAIRKAQHWIRGLEKWWFNLKPAINLNKPALGDGTNPTDIPILYFIMYYIYTILDYNYINIINHAVIIYNIYIYLLRWCYIETSGCCAHPKRSLEVAATAAALEMGREAIHFFAVEQWMGQKLWFHGRNIWIICANIWGKPIHHRYIYIWIICVNNMDNMNMDTKKPPKIW